MPATVPVTQAPATGAPVRPAFDLEDSWAVHAQVSIRPERFGALLYHFGTRRLSFLKDPTLLVVLEGLAGAPSARAACTAAGVTDAQLPSYRAALGTLAGSQMLVQHRPEETSP